MVPFYSWLLLIAWNYDREGLGLVFIHLYIPGEKSVVEDSRFRVGEVVVYKRVWQDLASLAMATVKVTAL